MEKHFVRIIKPYRGVVRERAFVRVEHTNTMVWLHQPPLLANTFWARIMQEFDSDRERKRKRVRERENGFMGGWVVHKIVLLLFVY